MIQKETIQNFRLSKEHLIAQSKKIIPNFVLSEHIDKMYTIVAEYVNQEPAFEQRELKTTKGNTRFSLKKGLFFISQSGAGKSFLFEDLLKLLFNNFPKLRYRQMDIYTLQTLYTKNGLNAITTYNDKIHAIGDARTIYNIFIDDFGRESRTINFYTSKLVFMDHFIDLRSRLQKKHGVITHGSSNLNIAELKEFYSAPTYSRMLQLFNFIIIDSQIDFRTL